MPVTKIDDLGDIKLYEHSPSKPWTPLSRAAKTALASASLQGIETLHVGQGDCTAVIAHKDDDPDGNSPIVVLYVDLGRACGKCAKTFPGEDSTDTDRAPPTFDFTQKPKVLLTHWDKDHYYSALHEADALTVDWMVPRQAVGPHVIRFINRLSTVLCFPATSPGKRFPLTTSPDVDLWIEVSKGATGSQTGDKNLTGLSFTLVRKDAAGDEVERIVLTGDAPYQFVPSLSGGNPSAPGCPICCLHAFHHGSKTHLPSTTDPVSLPQAKEYEVVFTYGLTAAGVNNFHHPAQEAMDYYKNKGWLERVNTASAEPTTTDCTPATSGQAPKTGGPRRSFFSRTS